MTSVVARLVEQFEARLAERQVRFRRASGQHDLVPGGVAMALDGVDADTLCAVLARTVQLSTGSACNSGQIRTSHVLESMGYSEEGARSVMRIFFNRYSRSDDVDFAAEAISAAIPRSRLADWRGGPVEWAHAATSPQS